MRDVHHKCCNIYFVIFLIYYIQLPFYHYFRLCNLFWFMLFGITGGYLISFSMKRSMLKASLGSPVLEVLIMEQHKIALILCIFQED